ncbi:hypothetical protein NE647_16125, partial [Blautia coccoides]|uniref:hypothetical protein n=1 Tax=Blautia producta TaxID=33035 RepID=UPI002109A46E
IIEEPFNHIFTEKVSHSHPRLPINSFNKKKGPKNLTITRKYSVYKAFGTFQILALKFIANFA